MKIWVYAEQSSGKLASVTLELLGKARELAAQCGEGKVSAVLLGSGVEELADTLFDYGAETVYIADDVRLRLYQHTTYAPLITRLCKKEEPDIFLFGATALGSELGPTIAAQLNTGIAAHCMELKLDANGMLISVVPAFGGKILGDILCPGSKPQMASVKPGIFQKPEPAPIKGAVVRMDLSPLESAGTGIKALQVCQEEPRGIPLEDAEVVICGGWGLKSAENWRLIEELAELLGGASACTRPVVDEGWAPGEHIMIGTSGKSVRPKIYLAFGVSGATHHICGMKDSGLVISVNNDENAPIFEVSDYAISADLNKILPLLTEKIRQYRDYSNNSPGVKTAGLTGKH